MQTDAKGTISPRALGKNEDAEEIARTGGDLTEQKGEAGAAAADEATEKTMAVDDRAARTVWVGRLPASMSTGSDVEKILRRVGDIESAHVRVRSTMHD